MLLLALVLVASTPAPVISPPASQGLDISIDDLAGPAGPGPIKPKHHGWEVEPGWGWGPSWGGIDDGFPDYFF
ncbi:hypothetical protein [Cyanobium sp. WAJ14-Wanaka]|uniref:hypothetical protein n=1 Tax=Cyanobium sp. WAJ14-Wanaka TaxID=2823725 RepID=UPI0020CF6766|nr:hypothetical protein [Cyanobium sp. WAJ14-Wanaka]MCP9774358.1 hypothetical protein [Cyanobium sp. WAJ14-Wanaka]